MILEIETEQIKTEKLSIDLKTQKQNMFICTKCHDPCIISIFNYKNNRDDYSNEKLPCLLGLFNSDWKRIKNTNQKQEANIL